MGNQKMHILKTQKYINSILILPTNCNSTSKQLESWRKIHYLNP